MGMKKIKSIALVNAMKVGALSFIFFSAVPAFAQTVGGGVGVSKPLVLLLSLAALSLAPFMVIMATSFVKLAVVLALIRNALGTQQVPPNLVITGLALILTVYIMVPVGQNVYRVARDVINQGSNQSLISQHR